MSATGQIAHFRRKDLVFSYPVKPTAVWIDDASGAYICRYPYDPIGDSDVDAAGNFIGDPKTFPRETFFSVKTDEANNETFEKYIAHAHIFVDSLQPPTAFVSGNVGGYTASYVAVSKASTCACPF